MTLKPISIARVLFMAITSSLLLVIAIFTAAFMDVAFDKHIGNQIIGVSFFLFIVVPLIRIILPSFLEER